jgi:predicted RNA-binding protein with PUA-like domain
MNKLYIEISKLTNKFRKMAFGICHDENKINEAVQELMLYFLQMNPTTLKNIYDKDGIEGVTKYGAVALRRALTSKRSNFYYKYEKYYTHIDGFNYVSSNTMVDDNFTNNSNYYKSIENLPKQDFKNNWKQLEIIDSQLDKLNWYDAEVFKLYYYQGNTLDSLAEKTRISRNSLFTTIDKVRNILKKECNEVIQSEEEK